MSKGRIQNQASVSNINTHNQMDKLANTKSLSNTVTQLVELPPQIHQPRFDPLIFAHSSCNHVSFPGYSSFLPHAEDMWVGR